MKAPFISDSEASKSTINDIKLRSLSLSFRRWAGLYTEIQQDCPAGISPTAKGPKNTKYPKVSVGSADRTVCSALHPNLVQMQCTLTLQTPFTYSRSWKGSTNPFTPKSDHFSDQITVWRTWLFIAYSDERWLYSQFSLHHLHISLFKVGRMYFLRLVWNTKKLITNELSRTITPDGNVSE